MAYILISSKRTQQPQGPVGIADEYKGIIEFLVCGNNKNNLALKNISSVIPSARATAVGIGGTALSYVAGGGGDQIATLGNSSSEITFLGVFSLNSAVANAGFLYQRSVLQGMWLGSSGLELGYEGDNNGYLYSSGLTFSVGQLVCGAVSMTNTEARMACNGKTNVRTGRTITLGAFNGYLGQDSYAANRTVDGNVYLAAVFNKALSVGHLGELTKNPWQLFRPIQRRIYVPSAGAAGVSGTSAGTFTATGTAAGTVAVSATSAATVSMTGAAAGAVEVKATSAATVTATGSATGAVGSVPISATSAGTFTASGAAAGTVAVKGTSAGTIAATGAAAGALAVKGTSAGAFDLLGAAAGAVGNVPVVGTSSATLTVSGAAAGAVQVQGTSAAQIALSGATAAQIRIDGTSAIAVSVTGSAFATSQGALQATSAGVFSLTGAATAVLWSRDDIDGTGRTRIGRGRTGSVSGGIGRGGSARGRIGPGRP